MVGKVFRLIGSLWLLAGLADVRAAERPDALDRAIAAGDVAGVRNQLSAGADAVTGFGGFARLSIAASQRPCVPDIITALIEHGADPASKDSAVSSTALLHAAASGSQECFQNLLAAGSDPSHINAAGSGIVTEAYLSGQLAFFEWVLASRKASPKHPDDLAKALLASLKKKDWRVCGLLLAAGADPKRRVVDARQSRRIEDWPEGAMLGRCNAPSEGALRDYVLVSAARICSVSLLLIGSVGCHGSPPVELFLSHSKAEDVLQVTIKNNSAEEIVVSRRFLTMLPRESSELRVVVATKDGATVPMCRGLDYFGPESHLEVGAGQSVSTEIHASSLIQTHCLEKGVPYTVQFEMGRNDEYGGQRRLFSNSLSLNAVVGR